jgi:hypothetical protein
MPRGLADAGTADWPAKATPAAVMPMRRRNSLLETTGRSPSDPKRIAEITVVVH